MYSYIIFHVIKEGRPSLSRSDDPVVRASVLQTEGRGLEARPNHTKDFKSGTKAWFKGRISAASN